MSQDFLSSPDSNGLFIEDREELNLGLLEESEEEEEAVKKISKLSDLVSTRRRPMLTETRRGGDSMVSNSRKLR